MRRNSRQQTAGTIAIIMAGCMVSLFSAESGRAQAIPPVASVKQVIAEEVPHAGQALAPGDPSTLASPAWRKLMGGETTEASTGIGLKVHGHWIIDVKDADGKLTQHRDFENSLSGGGGGFLVGMLSGALVSGDWMVVLGASSGSSPCLGPSFQFCGIVRSASTYPGLGYCGVYLCSANNGLTYTANYGTSFGGPYSYVLSGQITANQTGTIGVVYSIFSACGNNSFNPITNPSGVATVSPSSCVTQTSPQPLYGPFTNANITPVSVTNGQIIQVTVTITFS